MPKKPSQQHKMDQIRPPRVQITYDVHIGDSIEMKEIPFVVGVLADLSGKPDSPLPELKHRKFAEIDRDNFDQVLEAAKPRAAFRVDNKLTGGDTKLGVELRFRSMDDFHPEQIVKQVEPLRQLAEARRRLSDLLNKMDGNDKLVELLEQAISNTEAMQKLGQETGMEQGSAKEAKEPEAAAQPEAEK